MYIQCMLAVSPLFMVCCVISFLSLQWSADSNDEEEEEPVTDSLVFSREDFDIGTYTFWIYTTCTCRLVLENSWKCKLDAILVVQCMACSSHRPTVHVLVCSCTCNCSSIFVVIVLVFTMYVCVCHI